MTARPSGRTEPDASALGRVPIRAHNRVSSFTEGLAMTMQQVASAMQRAQNVLARRPDMGLQDDAPASARWEGGTRIVSRHANGTRVPTDMPFEVGGTGDEVTPGWLFRAGFASCAATSIAMHAAAEGIALSDLEVTASSRSDTRGLLGMSDAQGAPVDAAPRDLRLHVRITAAGVAQARLQALVEDGLRHSPIPSAVRSPVPIELHIDVEAT
jgi:uncharacterized OsmC-like protein